MIKYWMALGTAIATLFILAGEAHSADLGDVRKLIQTNTCKGCDLSDAKLSGLDLTDADLTGANLLGADLSGANLARANLNRANLQSANISKANFTGAKLIGANLTQAQNSDICVNGVLFGMGSPQGEGASDYRNDQRCLMFSLMGTFGPELCEPEFGLSELEEWKLICEVIESTSGSLGTLFGFEIGSFFRVTSFFGADMTGATVKSVNLKATDFRYATLNQANFEDTDLTYALMLDADIQGISETLFQPAFVTKDDIKLTIQEAIAKEKETQRQAEGPSILGTLMRSQQAYVLENGRFADNIGQLYVYASLSPPSDYDYAILQSDGDKTVITARSLVSDQKSYVAIGTSFSDQPFFQQFWCVTLEPSQSLPDALGEIEPGQCPVGMTEYE